MKYLTWCEIIKLAVMQSNEFAVYVSSGLDLDNDDDKKTLSVLKENLPEDIINTFLLDTGIFLFDSEKEADDFYSKFELEHIYASSIYAALYCPKRGCLTENT
jgi:hypothetical protein